MNEKLQDFINNMGVLCETWIIIYNGFVQHGMDHKTALEHTQAFMTSIMKSNSNINGGKEE